MSGNEQQNKAIVWNTGPALILAGPGSGKTFTTVERIRYLIEVHHVDPSQILVITFTKAAARQMRERFFARMEGVFHPVSFGTFHAIFFHILQSSCHYDPKSVLTQKEKREYLRIALSGISAELPTQEDWEEGLLAEIGALKNAGNMEADFKSVYLEKDIFQKAFVRFQKLISEMGRLDLDDFAAAVKHLFATNPEVLAQWQQQFSYILVDEFQDINATQYAVVQMLAGRRANLFVVGDDDQAIYGFRGADPSIMQQFERDYPQAVKILLSANYRSSPGIVETAGKLISVNQKRFSKHIRAVKQVQQAGIALMDEKSVFWKPLAQDHTVWLGSFADRRQQAETLANMIENKRKREPERTIAAIFRTNTDAVWLAEELERKKIPFRMREKIKNPYAQPVCRDLTAYLAFAKAAQNRGDFFRIMNKPCRYLSRQMVSEEQVSFPALFAAYRDKPYMQPILKRMQEDVGRMAGMDLYAAVNYVRKGIGYDAWLQKEMGEAQFQEAMGMADFFQDSVKEFLTVEQLTAHMDQYGKALLEAEKEEAGAENAVSLTTMHGAKGLEFDIVFLPDCNEGVVPHKKSMKGKCVEEERRIFYVGMTRARELLYLSWVSGTKESPGFPSRFLHECGYREPYRSL